ncbi:MAG: HK97 family phage prohead protease [Bacilli bacterium]|nr:HK97 family phage prohead protease [Bacilli bacterium]
MEKKMEKRQSRRDISFSVQARSLDTESSEMIVEGKAVSFDSPTVLFTWNGVDYYEKIDRNAFSEAKMDDVIFNYNHGGKVMARTRNNTLTLDIREDGLYMRADLSGTEEGRKLYEEIKGGYIDRMSFQFTVKEESYDSETHMWTVYKVKRLYDVSAVDIPAYEDTSIEARRHSILEAEAQAQEQREREAAAEIRMRKLALRTKLLTM